ncbi:uncharacterized protein LOC121378468 [Gigantopelta aegis]|uniref:uncharacterized protein LOC121378468 n=1 Tax=Gigantopelta aegis TaxID=1735272 RepID=UPI001B8892BE|nr:uncharacterized protein LOC121378468 [Gigantopelta aegis]
MSVTHPLLKILKGALLDLHQEKTVILDRNPKLIPLCKTIEDILRCGLTNNSSWFSRTDYWSLISKITRCTNPNLEHVIDYTKNCQKTLTIEGKGRLFIRASLVKRTLDYLIQTITSDVQLMKMWYDPRRSIIGNDILCEILLSLVREINGITFKLVLKNASFLDITWTLPIYKEYEFVPCDVLGIHFQEVDGYLLVVEVDSDSVAGEDKKICPGDILDDMFGEGLKGGKKGKVQLLFNQYKGLPVYAGFVKACDSQGNIYRPISKLLRMIDLDPEEVVRDNARIGDQSQDKNGTNKKPAHALLPQDDTEELPVHGPEGRASYNVTYLGQAILGADGRVDRIEDAVEAVINTTNKKPKQVILETSETGIVLIDRPTGKVVLANSFTEISACGRRTDYMQHFAFISGETTCNMAQNFICHVFHSSSADEAKIILCSIAQGFERTHWFL